MTAGPKPWFGLIALVAIACQLSAREPDPLLLDIADDGRQLKLLVRHSEIGPVCELWCYEGGPFHYGTGSKTSDGKVVFVHTSGKMKATTTFTPAGPDRVIMDVLVEGPLDELKTVNLVGPCMQFWHSPAFQRRNSLLDFAERCFLYTMRGPVGMLDTARGPMPDYKPEAPENNPPWTQWYVPAGFPHPGSIWAFGASGDRPVYGLVGVVSKDGRWLSGIGCSRARNVGQGWHDCIHHVPGMQSYLDVQRARIVHRSVLYVMPNDKSRLLQSFRGDFPEADGSRLLRVVAGADGTLKVTPPSGNSPPLSLSLGVVDTGRSREKDRSRVWEPSRWGGFVRQGEGWRMWANPEAETIDLAVSLEKDAGRSEVEAALLGQGWRDEGNPDGALVRRSADGEWIASLVWERSAAGRPARGVLAPGEAEAAATSVRGRLFLTRDDIAAVRKRWAEFRKDWKNSVPYRMPVEESGRPVTARTVRFAPNAEEDMTYGLTVIPPWQESGTVHINFPEHLEYGAVGHGILRHHDKRANPWTIAPDGRSASYEVESLELPGVRVQASAIADGDRARLSLNVTNGTSQTLERVKPLLCFWYAKLAGFPAKLSDNFKFIYVARDGKPVALADIPTENPDATAKVAYVHGCSQHDCDKFARSRGGLIESDLDLAWIAVTAKDGKRKAVVTFTPGKSILSNAVIPCAHADPYLGTLAPGQSVRANGQLFFTEDSLEEALDTDAR